MKNYSTDVRIVSIDKISKYGWNYSKPCTWDIEKKQIFIKNVFDGIHIPRVIVRMDEKGDLILYHQASINIIFTIFEFLYDEMITLNTFHKNKFLNTLIKLFIINPSVHNVDYMKIIQDDELLYR